MNIIDALNAKVARDQASDRAAAELAGMTIEEFDADTTRDDYYTAGSALIGCDGLFWFRDGDATVIVRETFVDLQESPAVFLQCPFCGCADIIPPAERYRRFTCNGCGRDYAPDLSHLTAKQRDA